MIQQAVDLLPSLYESDETAWLEAMSELIHQGRLNELDYAHLREYLADMARRDRREVAAVLVPDRKAVEQIFDGVEAGALEVGGAPGADAFEELQRRRQKRVARLFVEGKGRRPLFGHCTTIAWPRCTWISRMREGSANGSSRLMPAGF